MIEIIIHNRGGQGGVTAVEILAKSLLKQGIETQSFPQFGPERAGTPVTVSMRIKIDKAEVLPRCQIYNPDCVIVFDVSLMRELDVVSGLKPLKPNGWLIINTPREPSYLYFRNLGPFMVATVDATKIAIEQGIGTKALPIVNTAMLGAMVKVLGFSLESLCESIKEKFREGAERNIKGAERAYREVRRNE